MTNIKHSMFMIYMEIFQLDCYAVPKLPPSRNPLHDWTQRNKSFNISSVISKAYKLYHFHRKEYRQTISVHVLQKTQRCW